MKWLFRVLLLLTVYVLCGYGYLQAHTYRDNLTLTYKSADSDAAKRTDKLKATEVEEDDDLVSFKKRLDVCNYFTALFSAQLSGYFKSYLANPLASAEHPAYSSPEKYIMFLVIRT